MDTFFVVLCARFGRDHHAVRMRDACEHASPADMPDVVNRISCVVCVCGCAYPYDRGRSRREPRARPAGRCLAS